MKVTLYVNRILAVGSTHDGQRKGIVYVLTNEEFATLYPHRHRRHNLMMWVVGRGELVEVYDLRVEMLDELFDFRFMGADYFVEDALVMEATIKNAATVPSQALTYFLKEENLIHGVIVPSLRKELHDFLEVNQKELIQMAWAYDSDQK